MICEDQKNRRKFKFQDEISLCSVLSLEFVPNAHLSFKKHKMSAELHGFELSAQGFRTVELYHSDIAVTKKWVELIIKHRRENTSKKENRESLIKNRSSTGLDRALQHVSISESKNMSSSSISDVTSNYNSTSNYGSISSGNILSSPLRIPRTNSSSTVSSLSPVVDHRGWSVSSNDSNKSSISKLTSSAKKLLKLGRRRSKYASLSESQQSSSSMDLEKTGEEIQSRTDNLKREAQGEETVKEISPFVKRFLHEATIMNNCRGRSLGHGIGNAESKRLVENPNERSALGQLYEPSANSELLL